MSPFFLVSLPLLPLSEWGFPGSVPLHDSAVRSQRNATTAQPCIDWLCFFPFFVTARSRARSKIETPSGALADGIDFSAMDRFMTSILSTLTSEGALIARVFPPQADVLLYFLERVANDVVSEYITSLLAAAQPLRKPLFLLATAATFGQVYRLVDCVLEIRADSPSSSSSTAAAAAGRESEADSEEEPTRPPDAGGGGPSPPPPPPLVTKERAEDVVFRMFEPLMDDYLAEEGEWIREVLEGICDEWDRKVSGTCFLRTFLPTGPP